MNWREPHITVFLGFAVIAWAVTLYFQGTTITKEHLAPFGTVVSVLVVAGLAFEKSLWAWPSLHGWMFRRPDLRGTWRVELRSTWRDPATGVQPEPIEGFMAVTQSLSRLQMHLMTRESESWLIAEQIAPSVKNRGYQVAAVYTNQPQLHLRGHRSEIHFGAFVLETHGDKAICPDGLSGEYWTDRLTAGSMVLSNRVPKVHSRFEDARGTAETAPVPR